MNWRRATVALVVTLLARSAWGQVPEADLSAVRSHAEISEEDRNAVRAFLTKRIEDTRGNDNAAAQQATSELRSAFDGSNAFKQAYAALAVEIVGSAYKKTELLPATRLLTVINSLNVPETLPVLLDALQDERVGVRAAAAIGLRALREKLAPVGRDTFQRALNALKEAGKKERSRDTLKMIYAAMDYASVPSGADAKATATALLELLEERAHQYASGQVRAEGADDTGLRMAQALAGSMDEAERKRLTLIAATLAKYAIERYATGAKLANVRDKTAGRDQLDARDAMERLIIVSEELLATLLKPEKPPTVAESMRRLNTADMKNKWGEWVALLQKATNQDFTLVEAPDAESETPGDGGGGS